MIKVSAYTDRRVNSFEKYDATLNKWIEIAPKAEHAYTKRCYIRTPDGINIGRVDHFMKTSIKAIVNAYIKQVVKREGQKGEYILTIEMNSAMFDGEPLDPVIISIYDNV